VEFNFELMVTRIFDVPFETMLPPTAITNTTTVKTENDEDNNSISSESSSGSSKKRKTNNAVVGSYRKKSTTSTNNTTTGDDRLVYDNTVANLVDTAKLMKHPINTKIRGKAMLFLDCNKRITKVLLQGNEVDLSVLNLEEI
jgi:hypothetical protein